MILGCIADDFTGASDLANTLAKGGMRTVQYVGVPSGPADAGVEAGVVALKSRTIPVAEAVDKSLKALAWLRAQGAQQILFKYCSTFDSTPRGNIGPVAEALWHALDGAAQPAPVIFCPAFPGTGRTIYQGHLFVGDRPLNESGMQNHPLTPMTDADLRRVLAPQCEYGVGHLPAATVARGPEAARAAMLREAAAGRHMVVADAISDDDLRVLGKACEGLPLITGGSGVALGLPDVYRAKGLIGEGGGGWTGAEGPGAVLSGSCSIATRGQVARYAGAAPALEISADAVIAGDVTGDSVAQWLLERIEAAPMAYSSADPEVVKDAQARHGREALAGAVEGVFADAARALAAAGVRRIVVAGGETSGAVVESLAPDAFEIGPEIDPGVPALKAGDLALALKSGNFGVEDFFERAL
ncbi:MAG: 3-oxo-tetronate kinase, partial [Pseudomonadota bacterium]